MSGLNPHRGEVEFDLFVGAPGFADVKPGDVYLRFTTDDLARICAELKIETTQEIASKIQQGSVSAAVTALAYGLKTRGENAPERKFVTNKKWLEDTPFAIGVATAKVGDALVWNLYGKTAGELVSDYMQARANAGGDDTNAPFQSSNGSSLTEL